MLTWLIGEAPAPGMTPEDRAFSSSTGQRMSEWLGRDVRDVFLCDNLLKDHPGRAARGSLFPAEEAREAALDLVWTRVEHHDRLILCGKRVAKAFRVHKSVGYLEWGPLWRASFMKLPPRFEAQVAILPHPSGLNTWYNDPNNIIAARRFLRKEAKRMEKVSGTTW